MSWCPKCKNELGNYHWSGNQCSCGEWITPAFQIANSKIDKEKLNKIISDIEKNLKNKEDVEYVKTQIYNLSLIFLDEIDRVSEMNMKKMEALAEKYREINDRVEEIEDSEALNKISAIIQNPKSKIVKNFDNILKHMLYPFNNREGKTNVPPSVFLALTIKDQGAD